MTVARNIKLGLFAIGAIAGAVIAAIVIGIHAMAPNTVEYHTYFDESVQGLDVGSPVKYRGVRIGAVKGIHIAPDRRHVDVVLALLESHARKLGLAASTPDLRTELEVQGLTGLKDVEIDFFDPATNPPPELPFEPEENYIPSKRSLLTGISGDLEVLAHELPELVENAKVTFGKLDRVLDDIHDQQLVARAGEMVDRVAQASAAARRVIASIDDAHLPAQAKATLASADAAIADARKVLTALDGDHGLVASAHRATDSFGEVGRKTSATADDLDRTVRELGDAARAVRELAEELDREPDILVKGRGKSGRR